jgi:catechol 2,3-dioxygenase-like lactoylglutathione lyase family enzyme
MKFRKLVGASIYSSDLEKMKEFYVDKLGLEFVSEQIGRHVFLKTDKNMLLIWYPEITAVPLLHHQWFTSLLKSKRKNMRRQRNC